MLDHKDIIIKHYALGMSGREIARTLLVSKTGNSFLNAFKECKTLSYPLPEGITNYGIASAVTAFTPRQADVISPMNCRTMRLDCPGAEQGLH